MPTPEEIAAMTPEQLAEYYKSLYDGEVAAHGTTKDLLAKAQSDLTAEQESHSATKTQAADEIGKLSEKLANATKSAAQGFVTVDHGDKTYKVIGKQFNIKGKIVTVDDLLTDSESMDYLVSKGSHILQEVK